MGNLIHAGESIAKYEGDNQESSNTRRFKEVRNNTYNSTNLDIINVQNDSPVSRERKSFDYFKNFTHEDNLAASHNIRNN